MAVLSKASLPFEKGNLVIGKADKEGAAGKSKRTVVLWEE